MATVQCDIAIIGGGSAGYAAARTAHAAGANVAVIDQGPWGGLCILRGCMPSKAILRSAEIAAHLGRAAEFGLAPVEVRADLAAIIERKARLVADFAAYRREQLSDGRFALCEARARFLSPQALQAGGDVVEAGHFIIATGSTPHRVLIPGLDQVGYITSDEALDRVVGRVDRDQNGRERRGSRLAAGSEREQSAPTSATTSSATTSATSATALDHRRSSAARTRTRSPTSSGKRCCAT